VEALAVGKVAATRGAVAAAQMAAGWTGDTVANSGEAVAWVACLAEAGTTVVADNLVVKAERLVEQAVRMVAAVAAPGRGHKWQGRDRKWSN